MKSRRSKKRKEKEKQLAKQREEEGFSYEEPEIFSNESSDDSSEEENFHFDTINSSFREFSEQVPQREDLPLGEDNMQIPVQEFEEEELLDTVPPLNFQQDDDLMSDILINENDIQIQDDDGWAETYEDLCRKHIVCFLFSLMKGKILR